MTIRYKNKPLVLNLFLGITWIVLGILWIFNGTLIILVIGYLLFGIAYLVIFGFMYFNQYLTFENGVLTKKTLKSQKIILSEIIELKKSSGEITLKTSDSSLKINTDYIDDKSLEDLSNILDKVKLGEK